jgi:hypothetical protein
MTARVACVTVVRDFTGEGLFVFALRLGDDGPASFCFKALPGIRRTKRD